MADISMCKNQECKSKDNCHRFTAPANRHWQTYAEFTPKKGEDKCDDFWDNSGYNKTKAE